MRESEALAIVERLRAAFPQYRIGMETMQLYAEKMLPLRADVMGEVVDDMIRLYDRWPVLSVILDAYKRAVPPQPALPEPELTEEQRQENAAKARELLARLMEGTKEVA